MRTDNPIRDHERYESDLMDREAMLPTCDLCKEPIQDLYYVEFYGKCICKDCLISHRVRNEVDIW